MISISEFSKEFISRHDFEYDDLYYLEDKYSNIVFSNIPQAWVFQIDNFLSKIDYNKVKSISQAMGFPIIDCNNLVEKEINTLKTLEKDLQSIDIDLHNQLDAIILN